MNPKELQTFTAMSGITAGAKAGQDQIAKTQITASVAPAAPVAPTAPQAPDANIVIAPKQQNTKVVQVVHPGGAVNMTVESVSLPNRNATPTLTTPARRPAISITGIKSNNARETKERALDDALQVAQIEVMKELQKLNPPVYARPTLTTIRSQYLRRDGVVEVFPTAEDKAEMKTKGVDTNQRWVTIDVELTEEHVQKLRAGERVNSGMQVGGIAFAMLLAAYGFLRLDAWTKGYLTMWLAIGAVAVVAVAAFVVLA